MPLASLASFISFYRVSEGRKKIPIRQVACPTKIYNYRNENCLRERCNNVSFSYNTSNFETGLLCFILQGNYTGLVSLITRNKMDKINKTFCTSKSRVFEMENFVVCLLVGKLSYG